VSSKKGSGKKGNCWETLYQSIFELSACRFSGKTYGGVPKHRGVSIKTPPLPPWRIWWVDRGCVRGVVLAVFCGLSVFFSFMNGTLGVSSRSQSGTEIGDRSELVVGMPPMPFLVPNDMSDALIIHSAHQCA